MTHLKTTLLGLAVIALTTQAISQSLSISSYVEKTKVAPKLGTTVGIRWESSYDYCDRPFSVEAGGFYQSAMQGMIGKDEVPASGNQERYFAGAYMETPLVYLGSVRLNLNVRTGVQNGENFIISPTLKAQYRFNNYISTSFGVSSRSLQPGFIFDVKINL